MSAPLLSLALCAAAAVAQQRDAPAAAPPRPLVDALPPAPTPAPASVPSVPFEVVEPAGLPDARRTALREALLELDRRHPGVLRRLIIQDFPGDVMTTWGTAAKGELFLNRRLFDMGLDPLIATAAHEFGHLVFPDAFDTNGHLDWIRTFNALFSLEMSRRSPALYWFSPWEFSAEIKARRMPYESAPNPSELYAMAFAVKFLWPDRFNALVAARASVDEERRLVESALSRVKVQPWDGASRVLSAAPGARR